MNTGTKKLVMLGMLSAVAIVVALIRIPVGDFLRCDMKDAIIAIGGFIYGPISALLIGVVAALVEMVAFSSTGAIGCIMNILSTCAFSVTAAIIYKKKHNRQGAVAGLLAGVVCMNVVMLLWNYLITPLYMGVSRSEVAGMLLPLFAPFNLVKGGLNMAIVLLIYKPVVGTLRKVGLVEETVKADGQKNSEVKKLSIVLSLFLLATCIVALLVLNGKI